MPAKAVIRYAEAPQSSAAASGILDRPIKSGDDSGVDGSA
jgi:hypothetical protein